MGDRAQQGHDLESGGWVEIGGGLVQQQHLGLARKRPREHCAPGLPAEIRSIRLARSAAIRQAASARSTGAVPLSWCGMRPSPATSATVNPQAQRAPWGR